MNRYVVVFGTLMLAALILSSSCPSGASGTALQDEPFIEAKIRPDLNKHVTTQVPIMLITPKYDQGPDKEVAYIMIAPWPSDTEAEFYIEQPAAPDDAPIVWIYSGYAYMSTVTFTASQSGVRPTVIKWSRPRLSTRRVRAAGVGTRFCVQVGTNVDRVIYRDGSRVDVECLEGAMHNNRPLNDLAKPMHLVDYRGELPATGGVALDADARVFITEVERVAKEAGMPGVP